MENFTEMYKTICRLCLSPSKEENMFNLFDDKGPDGLSCYGKSVISFSKIILKINDNLPNLMCKKCLINLKQAIRFKFTCENSELCLKKLCKKSEETGEDFEENVCQYSLYNLYFPEKITKNTNNNTNHNKGNTKDNLTGIKGLPSKKPRKLETAKKVPTKRKNIKKSEFKDLQENIFDTNNFISYKTKRQLKKVEKQIPLNLTCNICKKVLANKMSYKCHMQRHNGCKYMCEICGKGFPMPSELNTHTVAVHGTGYYLQCDHCEYKASQKFLLVEHLRLHTGERPFTCDKCGLTFRRKALWKKHLIHHTEKSVQCQFCPKKFHRAEYLQEHMNSSHERKYMYSCVKCGCLYAKTKSVRKHLLEKHGIERELQGKIPKIIQGSSNFFSNEN